MKVVITTGSDGMEGSEDRGMACLSGKPLISYVLDWIVDFDVSDLYLVQPKIVQAMPNVSSDFPTDDLSDYVNDFVGDRFNCRYVSQVFPLGNAHATWLALSPYRAELSSDEPLLVVDIDLVRLDAVEQGLMFLSPSDSIAQDGELSPWGGGSENIVIGSVHLISASPVVFGPGSEPSYDLEYFSGVYYFPGGQEVFNKMRDMILNDSSEGVVFDRYRLSDVINCMSVAGQGVKLMAL